MVSFKNSSKKGEPVQRSPVLPAERQSFERTITRGKPGTDGYRGVLLLGRRIILRWLGLLVAAVSCPGKISAVLQSPKDIRRLDPGPGQGEGAVIVVNLGVGYRALSPSGGWRN